VCVSATLFLQHGALLKNIQDQKCFTWRGSPCKTMDFFTVSEISVRKGSSFISVDHIEIKYSVVKNCDGSDNNFLLKF